MKVLITIIKTLYCKQMVISMDLCKHFIMNVVYIKTGNPV